MVCVLVGVLLAKRAATLAWPWREQPPRVTHEMVVAQVQNVAKLVSTELTLRDVVTFEQSFLGMRRKALYVVTGKVLAGINLKRGVQVEVDDQASRIDIALPRAEILAVDLVDTTTYDERSGSFYRFTPQDRDSIQRLVRAQLKRAGEQSGLLPQADRSAQQILRSLFAHDGYVVEVRTRTELQGAPRQ